MSLAMSKLGKGNASHAIDDLQIATQLDSKSPEAGIALIRTQLNLRHFDRPWPPPRTWNKASRAMRPCWN